MTCYTTSNICDRCQHVGIEGDEVINVCSVPLCENYYHCMARYTANKEGKVIEKEEIAKV
jgi:hypothetical protein